MSLKTIKAPHILLPKIGTDMTAFAVIACDQFTSQIDYWDSLKNEIGMKTSTFKMIFPEAYLDLVNQDEYIANINKTIEEYLSNDELVDIGECFVLVERMMITGKKRLGLVISIDLEDYSYKKGEHTPIRASEATIVERIPPRLKIRENASVELPHILFLFDDPNKTIVEKLYAKKDSLPCIYDFELNKDGGHLRGYRVDNVKEVEKEFYNLLDQNKTDLLFVVGDGNHSLATAKAHWDKIKVSLNEGERETHPARYALVEAINLYDDGLIFEPIHRLVFDASKDFIDGLTKRLHGPSSIMVYDSLNDKENVLNAPENAAEVYKCVQSFIDEYLTKHPKTKVDYIHDTKHLLDVAYKNKGSIAIKMPSLTKGDIFSFIAKDEVLPRKSFSMGHAIEKRYYLEAKRIK